MDPNRAIDFRATINGSFGFLHWIILFWRLAGRELPYCVAPSASVHPLVETSAAHTCSAATGGARCPDLVSIRSISDSPSHPLHHHTSSTATHGATMSHARARRCQQVPAISTSLCVTDVHGALPPSNAAASATIHGSLVHDFTLELEATSSSLPSQ